jgi:hypothetical protein
VDIRIIFGAWLVVLLAAAPVASAGETAGPPPGSGSEAVAPLRMAAPRAILDFDPPPRTHSALDSIPHPWPGIATLISVAGTAVPIVAATEVNKRHRDNVFTFVMLASEVVTPAAGHLYGGVGRKAVRGAVIRGLGFAMIAGAAGSLGLWSNETSGDFAAPVIGLYLGALVMGAGAASDILTVGGAVERRNEARVRARAQLGLGIAPDGQTPSLVVRLRF